MRTPPPVFHPARPGLHRPVKVDPAGVMGPTSDRARGPRFRRTSRGYYLPADLPLSQPQQRIAEASVVTPAASGVTGWAGLAWLGASWFDGLADGGRTQLPVVIATGWADVRNQPGIRICQERLDPSELFELDGLVVTEPVRSVCFEMRYAASVRQAVAALDMAAYSDLVSLEEAARYASAHPGWTGIPQCRAAIALASENSWSRQETGMRLRWELDAELPRPLCNTPVFDLQGRHVGTPDLLDVEAGLVGEYDGALHLLGHQRRRDRQREEAFRELGLEYVTVMGGDTVAEVVHRIRSARARARFEPESTRRWTIDPPPWWVPTVTVAQRRSLSAWQRERLLAIRRPPQVG